MRQGAVLLPSECTATWPDLENPTSLDHALYLRSRARYIREEMRDKMRDSRGLYLTKLGGIVWP